MRTWNLGGRQKHQNTHLPSADQWCDGVHTTCDEMPNSAGGRGGGVKNKPHREASLQQLSAQGQGLPMGTPCRRAAGTLFYWSIGSDGHLGQFTPLTPGSFVMNRAEPPFTLKYIVWIKIVRSPYVASSLTSSPPQPGSLGSLPPSLGPGVFQLLQPTEPGRSNTVTAKPRILCLGHSPWKPSSHMQRCHAGATVHRPS